MCMPIGRPHRAPISRPFSQAPSILPQTQKIEDQKEDKEIWFHRKAIPRKVSSWKFILWETELHVFVANCRILFGAKSLKIPIEFEDGFSLVTGSCTLLTDGIDDRKRFWSFKLFANCFWVWHFAPSRFRLSHPLLCNRSFHHIGNQKVSGKFAQFFFLCVFCSVFVFLCDCVWVNITWQGQRQRGDS